jgi:hypothetical protein
MVTPTMFPVDEKSRGQKSVITNNSLGQQCKQEYSYGRIYAPTLILSFVIA